MQAIENYRIRIKDKDRQEHRTFKRRAAQNHIQLPGVLKVLIEKDELTTRGLATMIDEFR